MTIRREIRVIDVLSAPEFRPAYSGALNGKWRLGTFKEGRKRTTYHFDVNVAGSLVVPGILHGVPADHERWSSFTMSATLNLAATPERIREVAAMNVNPNFANYDQIITYPQPPNSGSGYNGILVFPEAQTSHAVILHMRKTLAKEGA